MILAAETKLGGQPPRLPNSWITRNRDSNGGGVAIMIRNDLVDQVRTINEFDDKKIEILWVKILTKYKPIILGVYYGAQEGDKQNPTTYKEITKQYNTLKHNGKNKVTLAGDFNAKLKIDTENIKQNESSNGILLREMIKNTNSVTVTLKENIIEYTREHRTIPNQKSIID